MSLLLQKLKERRLELESIEIEDDFQSLVVKARIMELETITAMVEQYEKEKRSFTNYGSQRGDEK